MPRILRVLFSAVPAVFLLLLCDPKREIVPDNAIKIDTTITYTKHIAPMIAAHCSACHISIVSGGANFSTYDNVKSLIERIIVRTEAGTMPPQGSGMALLTPAQVDTLKIWKASGVRQ